MNRISILEGYDAIPGTAGRRTRRRSRRGGSSAHQRRFAAAARACAGKGGKRGFQACMRKKLKKGRR